jgi:hypothetical protein
LLSQLPLQQSLPLVQVPPFEVQHLQVEQL